MGLRESVKRTLTERKAARKESLAFKKIVARRTLQARRQSYEKEALVQAKLKGERIAKEQATRPTFGQRVGGAGKSLGKFAFGVAEKATRPPQVRKAPVRRFRYVTTRRRVPVTPKKRRR